MLSLDESIAIGYLSDYPKVECPDRCRYRSKAAPFCGYCMLEILGRKKEMEDTEDGKIDKNSAGQAEGQI